MRATRDFDDYARSMTRRLLQAAEAEPMRPADVRSASVPRAAAVLFATSALVAGLIVVGTAVLHIQLSHSPVNSPTPPPVITQTPTVAPTSTPTVAPSPTATPTSVIANLHMVTSTVGWAQRQTDGAILHTTHGVGTWSLATPPIGGEQVIAAAYVDADAARVLTATIPPSGEGTAAVIHSWATDDGGVSWIKGGSFVDLALEYEPVGTLDFVDREHGWFSITGLGAAGSSGIFVYRTVDGGAHWTEVDKTFVAPEPGPTKIPSGCDKNPVSFVNASTGWDTGQCNGGSAFLYVTHDGGVTWRSESLGVSASEYGYTTDPPQFVSGSVGFMVGYVGLPQGPRATVFVTTNGGATWTPRATPDYYPEASDFLDAESGWIQMNNPVSFSGVASLWVTHNAGHTWTNLKTNVRIDGLSIDFVTTQIGWAFTTIPVGTAGAQGLLQTTDGGHTWTAVTAVIEGA